MLIALVVLVVIGAFVLGITFLGWQKDTLKILSKTLLMLNQLLIQKCLMKMATCYTMNLSTSDQTHNIGLNFEDDDED